jgi:hypothetical protein
MKLGFICLNVPGHLNPTAAYSASAVDFAEAGRRRSSKSAGTGKEAAIEQRHRKALYWLLSLAALISLLAGVLCLLDPVKPRTADTDKLDLAAEGAPSHIEVTIGEAIQALGARH